MSFAAAASILASSLSNGNRDSLCARSLCLMILRGVVVFLVLVYYQMLPQQQLLYTRTW